ncbi:MAG: exodeoxyribonuclease VII large subunit [Clostridiales bacterium]
MPKIFSVSEINRYIYRLLSRDFTLSNILIKGEISNFKHHSSGHMYFTIKDEKSVIKAVMFRTEAQRLRYKLENGMNIVIKGRISLYERDGVYQIYVDEVKKDGIGDLYLAYEALKEKLKSKGFFDEKYKKSLPFLPDKICIITSKTGSVIKDILNVINRRFEGVEIFIYPVSVQGLNSSREISTAIDILNKNKFSDVIILARGGGSLEDLWSFNEEIVAKSIFKSKIPIISAIGHETDLTISDFVSDVRAPTPSAAAEMVVPDKKLLNERINMLNTNLRNSLKRVLYIKKLQFEKLQQHGLFKYPKEAVRNERIRLDNLNSNFINNVLNILKDKNILYKSLLYKFEGLSPLNLMKKGYGIIENEKDKKIIKSISEVNLDENININLIDGILNCKICDIKKRNI